MIINVIGIYIYIFDNKFNVKKKKNNNKTKF